MAKNSSSQKQPGNPLTKWLSLDWNRPERSYNPDVRDFLAGLLDYPKDKVVTEDTGGGGYPDIKLLTPEKIAWVVGDLKKDNAELNTESGRRKLWHQKRKYVEGLTRYVLFLTANYLWVVLPNGQAVEGFEEPCDLSNQICPNYDFRTGKKLLSEREHSYPKCGYKTHRDVNAYINSTKCKSLQF